MSEILLQRRDFMRAIAAMGALGAMPSSVLAKMAQSDWTAVQALMDEMVASGKVPGLAGAIGRGTDEAVFLTSGTISQDSKTAVTPDSLWRVYSMTKPITGMAAMMLIEDGKIGLDQNIADFIPGFAKLNVLTDPLKSLDSRPASGVITVRNLLTHTAGLGYSIITKGPLLQKYLELGITPAALSHMKLPGFPDYKTAPSLEEFANRLATLPLIADPGTKWSYSVSLDLMGRVIEVASGKSFDRFLQERLFTPLGMKDTFWQVAQKDVPRLTTNYFVIPTGLFAIDPPETSIFLDKPAFPFGGAGLVMSARDYDRFLRMLMGYGAIGSTRVMKKETAKLGMSNLLPAGMDTKGTMINGQGFGAGGRVTIVPDGAGHGVGGFGWGGAAATIAWVDPAAGIRASGYAQYMPDNVLGFPSKFAKAVYG